eukprot:1236766-Amphidinium_carterae.1
MKFESSRDVHIDCIDESEVQFVLLSGEKAEPPLQVCQQSKHERRCAPRTAPGANAQTPQSQKRLKKVFKKCLGNVQLI